VRGLLERIEAPMEKIKGLNKLVLDTEEARAIFGRHGALAQAMKEFEEEHVRAWTAKVSEVRSGRACLELCFAIHQLRCGILEWLCWMLCLCSCFGSTVSDARHLCQVYKSNRTSRQQDESSAFAVQVSTEKLALKLLRMAPQCPPGKHLLMVNFDAALVNLLRETKCAALLLSWSHCLALLLAVS
jgi:Dynein heavy chain, N-terminal region 1